MESDSIADRVEKIGEPIEIVGYGSLLSQASLERTIGSVGPQRLGRVRGYIRVFDKVCVHSLATGVADATSREIACCSAQEALGGVLLVSLSAISPAQLAPLVERESVYALSEVTYELLDRSHSGRALMFARPRQSESESDLSIEISRSDGGGLAYSGPLWRTDILPARAYLQKCISAAKALGEPILDNFLDQSFLPDRSSLRNYLNRHPEAAGDEYV